MSDEPVHQMLPNAAPAPGPGGPTDRPDGPAGAVAAEPPDGPTGASTTPRRRRRNYVLGAVVSMLVIGIVAANFVRLPYYVVSPGMVRPTQEAVQVEGRPEYRDSGEIGFTTVSTGEATAWSALVGWIDPDRDVFPEREYLGDQTYEDNRELNLRLMDNSKQTAEVVALRQLGYDVEASGTGAVVFAVEPGSAADGVLQAGDVIVAVDGEPVGVAEDLVETLGAREPGDEIVLSVEGAETEPVDVPVTLGTNPSDDVSPFLGVSVGTRNIEFDLPFEVSIDSGEVGGPSAGLAFTLAVIDVLSPGSLTGGQDVAVTGTIRLDGSVGPIGGIHQKVEAVKEHGSVLFLVPEEEYEGALEYADGLRVVAVRDVDDALRALGEIGGDVEVALGDVPAG